MPGPVKYYGILTEDLNGKPALGGGMGQKQPGDVGMVNHIGGDSVERYAKEVEAAGGKVLMPRTWVPGYGFLGVCVDPEGNKFGQWEEK